MKRDNFLDTNIIINYVNFDEKFYKKITKKCHDYILQNNGKIILCFAVVNELYDIMKKRSKINKIVLQMIGKNDITLSESLPKKEIPFAKKLYLQFKKDNLKKLGKLFLKEESIFETKIELFLKSNVDEKVIPIEQIDNELINKIHEIIPNHADCKILASAIQYQNTRTIFLFVTADGKDLDPNGYKYLKESFEINYLDEKYKFPELLNLMFTD